MGVGGADLWGSRRTTAGRRRLRGPCLRDLRGMQRTPAQNIRLHAGVRDAVLAGSCALRRRPAWRATAGAHIAAGGGRAHAPGDVCAVGRQRPKEIEVGAHALDGQAVVKGQLLAAQRQRAGGGLRGGGRGGGGEEGRQQPHRAAHRADVGVAWRCVGQESGRGQRTWGTVATRALRSLRWSYQTIE